jgi:hypothetical protein
MVLLDRLRVQAGGHPAERCFGSKGDVTRTWAIPYKVHDYQRSESYATLPPVKLSLLLMIKTIDTNAVNMMV